jgi:acyl carrier protein
MTTQAMTRDEVKAAVLEELTNVAPDLAEEQIPEDADLRDEFDLDSMDFLNWITALHRRFGVDIPELDYAKLGTLGKAVDYLSK